MLKIIQRLFGKPCRKGDTFQEKFFRFGYWFSVIFYLLFIGLSFALIVTSNIIYGVESYGELVGEIITLLIVALIFPLIFRVIYSLNLKGSLLKKED